MAEMWVISRLPGIGGTAVGPNEPTLVRRLLVLAPFGEGLEQGHKDLKLFFQLSPNAGLKHVCKH